MRPPGSPSRLHGVTLGGNIFIQHLSPQPWGLGTHSLQCRQVCSSCGVRKDVFQTHKTLIYKYINAALLILWYAYLSGPPPSHCLPKDHKVPWGNDNQRNGYLVSERTSSARMWRAVPVVPGKDIFLATRHPKLVRLLARPIFTNLIMSFLLISCLWVHVELSIAFIISMLPFLKLQLISIS